MSDANVATTARLAADKTAELLKRHGITPTQQRLVIGSVLFARPQHLSAEQLLTAVNRGRPIVSKATVYNTLGIFAERGLVREVIVDPAKVFYDSNTSAHHHFYDTRTGILSDIDDKQIAIERIPELPDGTEIEGVDVIVRLRGKRS